MEDACDFVFCPASYASALRSLRSALNLWGRLGEDTSRNFTLHSCKATVLSWCSQLGLGDMARREQGHHRTTSVTLYGRDDTRAALSLQASVSEPQLLVREGLAISGLEVPLRFRGVISEHSDTDPLQLPALPLEPTHSTADPVVTQSSPASASLEMGLSNPPSTPLAHNSGIFMASTKTIHRAVSCEVALSQVSWHGTAYKTACGAVVRTEWTILAELSGHGSPVGRRALCKRPSCCGSGVCL